MKDTGDPITRQAAARVGQTLRDKYRLEQLIGCGGMAAVYAATHRNGRRVAVKILSQALSLMPDARNRFLREGYVANKVNHSGAVAVLDDDEVGDGCVFLVMELLEGETLEALAEQKGGRLEAGEVLAIADGLLDVLAAAHAQGIIHRDLKPANVFVTNDGAIKVLDFGIARLRELSQGASETSTGVPMGTPAFMAPEQARGYWKLVDQRTDLWALGATMFTLLTGLAVHYDALTVSEMLIFAATRPARPVASILPVPADVAQIVDRALAFEIDQRWSDARHMQAAVRAALATRPTSSVIRVPRHEPGAGPTPSPAVLPTAPQLDTTGQAFAARTAAGGTQATSSRRTVGLAVAVLSAVVALGAGSYAALRFIPLFGRSASHTAEPPVSVEPPPSAAPAPPSSDLPGEAPPPAAASTGAAPSASASTPSATSASAAAATSAPRPAAKVPSHAAPTPSKSKLDRLLDNRTE